MWSCSVIEHNPKRMAKSKKKFLHEVQTCWKKNTDTVCQKAEVHAFPADALMQDYILFTLPQYLINMQMFLL